MKRISKHAVALSAIVTLSLAGVAQAAVVEDTTSATLTGADAPAMSAPDFGDFPETDLTGASQDVTANVPDWGVTDATGTGAGWEVSMHATVPQRGDGVLLTGAALTLTAPTASKASDNASAAPVVAGGNLLGTVKVADAATSAGRGAWTFTQGADHLKLSVPAAALAGSYVSTIETTLGPGV